MSSWSIWLTKELKHLEIIHNVVELSRVNVIILITGFVGLLNGFQRYLLPIALITYGWDIQSYGTIYFIQAFAMAVPLLLGGVSTDLQGRRSTVVISFLTFSVGVSIFSFVISGTSLLLLIVAQVVTTVSFGITRMALSIQMADETMEGNERTSSLGLQAGLRNLMGFIGPLVFGVVFENYELSFLVFTDFEVGFAILAILGLFGVFFAFLLPPTDYSLIVENRQVGITDIDDNQKSMQFAFGIEELILGFTSGLIVPFINFYILTEFAPTNWQWGLLIALGNIGVALGSIIASRHAEGFGKGRTVLLFNVVVPILASGIAFGPTLGIVSIFYVARITMANLIHPIWESWYFTHISKNLRGRTMSLIQVSRRVARAVGTLSGSFAFPIVGPVVFPLGCLFYPIAMAIPYLRERQLDGPE